MSALDFEMVRLALPPPEREALAALARIEALQVELVAALKAARPFVEDTGYGPVGMVLNQIDTVVAKARGEQP